MPNLPLPRFCHLLVVAAAATFPSRCPAQQPDAGASPVAARRFAAPSPPAGDTLFESLPAEQTGVDFRMTLPDPRTHIREFTLLSVYGGLCTGDYDGDGLTDFYVTRPAGGNRLFKNLGDFRFRDVTGESGVESPDSQGSGATFVDVDNDGDLDISACFYGSPNKLFINNGPDAAGRVTFTDEARRLGLDFTGASMTMAFADIDNDGDLDAYLATTGIAPPKGTKFRPAYENGRPVVRLDQREYWQILHLPNNQIHRTEAGQFDRLYRNDGGVFREVTNAAGIDGAYFSLAAVWWDYNRDGRPDLYVANDFIGPDKLYRNQGDGKFVDVNDRALARTPWFSMGVDIADVNNDGLIDVFTTDMSPRAHARRLAMTSRLDADRRRFELLGWREVMRNALHLGTGVERLQEASAQFGVADTDWTWNPRLADLDNDGFVDLFVTTGMLRDAMNGDVAKEVEGRIPPNSPEWTEFWAARPMLHEQNLAYRNRDGRRFEDVSAAWGLDQVGVSFGAATADFDNDGDLDMIVNHADGPLGVYRNNAGGRSLRIELRGRASNHFGVGAEVTVEAGGRVQAQYLTLARGWLSGIEPAMHFGLGAAARADAVTIRWPSGRVQRIADLAAGQAYTITEPEGPAPSQPPAARPLLVGISLEPPIAHEEQPFDDFAVQPLLPYRLSQPGPALAWGDVNGDGTEDFVIGGARGAPTRLKLNDEREGLTDRAVPAFAAHVAGEAAAACLFDADGDGDRDLYIATGSVEHAAADAAYRDQFYLNDGQGNFTSAPDDALPDLRDSGSVVVTSDVDHDGDADLFVGSRSVPGAYPEPPPNRLLINDGGKFADAAPPELQDAGMVTDAAWADLNGDGWDDLVVTVDWGPVRVFVNEKGRLVERTVKTGLADRTGWWLSVQPGDLDGDGDLDLVVGNFGRNSPYRASPEKPAVLYYGDVDGSGVKHIIETRTEGGVLYPRREHSPIAAQLPAVVAAYPTIADYARATVADLFGPQRLAEALRLEANTLDSGILWNDGGLKLRFEPLPDAAQLAPVLDAAIFDANADGRPDVVLAQNLLTTADEVGPLNGGVSLVLLGQPDGRLAPLRPDQSGLALPGQARHVHAIDLDANGRPDLVFGTQTGLEFFLNRTPPSP